MLEIATPFICVHTPSYSFPPARTERGVYQFLFFFFSNFEWGGAFAYTNQWRPTCARLASQTHTQIRWVTCHSDKNGYISNKFEPILSNSYEDNALNLFDDVILIGPKPCFYVMCIIWFYTRTHGGLTTLSFRSFMPPQLTQQWCLIICMVSLLWCLYVCVRETQLAASLIASNL